MYQKTENDFSTLNTRGKSSLLLLSCATRRWSQVDIIRGRSQWWHAFVPVSHRGVFSPDMICWRSVCGVWMACFVVAMAPDSVAVVVRRSSASGRVGM